MPAFKDLSGKTFNRLFVLRRCGWNKHGQILWLARCVCGNEIEVEGYSLQSGNTKSCRCLWKEIIKTNPITHGLAGTKEYLVWVEMRQRCDNPRHVVYFRYGGRGIKVDPRWDNFANFLEDMGPRPAGLTLERIDNEGPYSPKNCKWATRKEQSLNQRSNRIIYINGVKKHFSVWLQHFKLHDSTFYYRVNKMGWTEMEALTTPPRKQRATLQ